MGGVAYIGVGSNIGDSYRHCIEGLQALAYDERAQILALSSFYRTAPVSPVLQNDFLNGAAKIVWKASPQDLLALLLDIEQRVGRTRSVPLGPRTLDLDILLFDDLLLDTAGLAIPHPRLHERKFALVPCIEIDPHLVHPRLKRPLAELLAKIGKEQRIALFKRASLDEIMGGGAP